MTYGRRLNQALQRAGKSRADLAKELEVSVQAVGQVITGGRNGTQTFTAGNSVKAARFLGVDALWLATGEGEPTIDAYRDWPLSVPYSQFVQLPTAFHAVVEQFAKTHLVGTQTPRSKASVLPQNVTKREQGAIVFVDHKLQDGTNGASDTDEDSSPKPATRKGAGHSK